jgi:hypothetical protein
MTPRTVAVVKLASAEKHIFPPICRRYKAESILFKELN